MVEVFKTNVKNRTQAEKLLAQVHTTFVNYKANFDLEDVDRILRVKCTTGTIQASLLISFLKACGYNAEVLPGEIQF